MHENLEELIERQISMASEADGFKPRSSGAGGRKFENIFSGLVSHVVMMRTFTLENKELVLFEKLQAAGTAFQFSYQQTPVVFLLHGSSYLSH